MAWPHPPIPLPPILPLFLFLSLPPSSRPPLPLPPPPFPPPPLTTPSAITESAKSHLRSRFIASAVTEPVPQLAVQNAVIVGKVARLEYPLDWPDVFSELTTIIRDASQATSSSGEVDEATGLRLSRSLSVLLHVVKELATGRLIRTKANLQSVTPEVFRVLGGVYVRHVKIWHDLLGQSPVPPRTSEMMNISLLSLKILRRLIVAGYEFPNRVAEVRELWQILSAQVWSLLNAEPQLAGNDGGGGENRDVEATLLRKHVVNMGKLFLELAASHPAAFALLPETLQLLGKYWDVVVNHGETLVQQSKRSTTANAAGGKDKDDERWEFREKVALQGMLLFRSCAKMIFSPVSTFKCPYTTPFHSASDILIAILNTRKYRPPQDGKRRKQRSDGNLQNPALHPPDCDPLHGDPCHPLLHPPPHRP